MLSNQSVLVAFALTLVAGLSTGVGSLIALYAKSTNTRLLTVALGFSGGVMVYVSLVDMFITSRDLLIEQLGNRPGYGVAVASLFLGMLIAALIDRLVPEAENPHSVRKVEDMDDCAEIQEANRTDKLLRTGFLSAIAIAVHNFPEGIATFVASVKDVNLGIAITIAVAIHNIPEGLAVAVPVYYATNDRRKAFCYSFLSGLAEPLGALVGFLVLMPVLNDIAFGVIFAAVAGIMLFISFDELIPTAREFGENHLATYGLIAGMAVMAVSLVLLG